MTCPGHPNEKNKGGNSPAPLPGTSHIQRLMYAKENKPVGTPNIIVKAEWDEIEKWLVSNVDRTPEP